MRTTNSPENHREDDRTAQRRIATTDSYAEAEAVVERLDEAFADEAVRRLGAGGIQTP